MGVAVTGPDAHDRGLVRAAGGLVTRPREHRDGHPGVEVLVVHSPRYDDWSLPKGKGEPGERDEDTATREVEEETGYRCALGDEITTVRYIDRHGRDKQVRFWNMSVIGEVAWEPNDEVDERRWISPADAATLLTYEADRQLLRSLGGSA